ncbi:hypothetical protein AAD018_002570 [Aestuariibius insulae]|uniref:hypothetical protein n=1 Tax=Aestuariibius insulae TaxID=2058287 RepID=UPI00345EFE8B
MDLKTTRNDRGVSVFWMILGLGIATLIFIAILLMFSERDAEVQSNPDQTEEPVPPTGAGTNPDGTADKASEGLDDTGEEQSIIENGANTELDEGVQGAGDAADPGANDEVGGNIAEDAPDEVADPPAEQLEGTGAEIAPEANDEGEPVETDTSEESAPAEEDAQTEEEDSSSDASETQEDATEGDVSVDMEASTEETDAAESEAPDSGAAPAAANPSVQENEEVEVIDGIEAQGTTTDGEPVPTERQGSGDTTLEPVIDPNDGAPTDPDGGADPFVPTPSGPEGRDDDPLTGQ